MTIRTDWKMFIGGLGAGGAANGRPVDALDLTGRLRGAEVEWNTDFGKAGTARGTFVVDNSDGYFTPNPYDIDLAYDAPVSYGGLLFGAPVFVVGYADLANGTTQVVDITLPGGDVYPNVDNQFAGAYTGIVTGVDVADDGYTSTLTLFTEDPMSAFQRSIVTTTATYTTGVPAWQIVEDMVSKTTLPNFGGTITTLYSPTVGDDFDPAPSFTAGQTIGDVLAQMAASDWAVHQPWTIYFENNPSPGQPALVYYKHWTLKRDVLLLPDQVKADNDPLPILFAEPPFSNDALPFRAISYGFQTDRIITQSAVESEQDGGVWITPDPDLVILPIGETPTQKYGARSARLAQTATTTGARDQLAPDLMNWWDRSVFTANSIEVTGGMIESHASDAALPMVQLLMSPPFYGNGPLMRDVFIDATGAGGATLSFSTLFLSATLTLFGRDWVMTLSDGIDRTFGAFILNDTEDGVLDEDRI